jgi:hypothetical protein
MTLSNEEFARNADPHAWLMVADSLNCQARLIRKRLGSSLITYSDARGKSVTWDETNRTLFLLGGFALENLIKGFLVYENPHWIANGVIAKPLRSHCLVKLAAQSRRLPYKVRGMAVLDTFEQGLESWARYPCSLTKGGRNIQLQMNEILWASYVRTARSFSNKLIKLLRRKWHGPHGTSGHYEISDDFFSFGAADK